MLISLSGKTAVVTGGATGLGRMIAEGYLRAGAEVVITSRRPIQKALSELAQLGVCHGIELDLAGPGGADRLADEIASLTRHTHILVNNAGATWGGTLEDYPDAAWPKVMDLNVRVPFAVVQRLLPRLMASASAEDPARVINIGSIAGLMAAGLHAYSYSASKAALHHLSRELAAELGEKHVSVNTIVPGYFPTKMTSHIRADEEQAAQFTGTIPLGRFGKAQDISGLCVFLASEYATYMTGAQITLDGGVAAAGG